MNHMEPTKKSIDPAKFWGVIGAFLTIVVGIPAIYFTVHDRKPHISYEIIAKSKILDVHQPVKSLQILYQGEDIYAQHKNLTVITILIHNDGETDIRQSDFDQHLPWDLALTNGQLVDTPKIISCNSDYIRDNINIQVGTNNLITFQKIIFERGKYFTIQLQVLHRIEDDPSFSVDGKIAGIERQTVVENLKESGGPSFWGTVFNGSVSVQIARGITYFAGLFVALVVLGFSLGQIITALRRYRWRKSKEDAVKFIEPLFGDFDELQQVYLKRIFVASKGDVEELQEARNFLCDTNKVDKYLSFRNRVEGETPSGLAVAFDPSNMPAFPELISSDLDGLRLGRMSRRYSLFTFRSDDGLYKIYPFALPLIEKLIEFLKVHEVPRAVLKQTRNLGWTNYKPELNRPVDIGAP